MDNYFWGKVIVAVLAIWFLAAMLIKHNRDNKIAEDKRIRLKEEEEDRLFRAARKRKEAMELEEASRRQPMGMRVAGGHNPAEGKRPNNPPAPPPLRNPSRPSVEDNRRLDEIHRRQRSGSLPSSSGMRDAHRDSQRDDDLAHAALLITAAVVLSDNNSYCPPSPAASDYNCPTPSPDYGSDTTSGSYD